MMDWLTDTFIWTAALIALVLLIRRPVARHFGPQAAYALRTCAARPVRFWIW